MANTTNINNRHSFLWEKCDFGGPPITRRFKTLSNITLGVGDPVINTGGYLKLAGSTSTALFGFAFESVTGDAGVRKSIAVIPALNNYIFSAQHSSTYNLTAGNLGKRIGLGSSTSAGKIGVNRAATTSLLQIVGLKPGSTWGTYAQVLLKVIKSSFGGENVV